jgi:hypothetical protein
MSTHDGVDDDIQVNVVLPSLPSLTEITTAVRDQLLKDSRRLGNLFGPKAAQKKTPLASKPQPPGTQRVW